MQLKLGGFKDLFAQILSAGTISGFEKLIKELFENLSEDGVTYMLSVSNLSKELKQSIIKILDIKLDDSQLEKALNGKSIDGFIDKLFNLGSTLKNLKKIIVGHPLFKPGLVVAAIAAITGALIYLSKAGERAREEFNKSLDEYKNIKSEVASLNEELTTTRSRIDELTSKPHLSFVEQEELDRLKEVNKELERSIEQKRIDAELARVDARSDAIKSLNTREIYKSYDGWTDNNSQDTAYSLEKMNTHKAYENLTPVELAKKALADYNKYKEQKAKLEQEIANDKKLIRQSNLLIKEINSMSESGSNTSTKSASYFSGLLGFDLEKNNAGQFINKQTGEVIDLYKTLVSRYDQLLTETGNITEQSIENKESGIQKLDELMITAGNTAKSNSVQFDSYLEMLDPNQDSDFIDGIEGFQDDYVDSFKSAAQEAQEQFDEIWNSEGFRKQKKELLDKAKDRTLSASDLEFTPEETKEITDSISDNVEPIEIQVKPVLINDVLNDSSLNQNENSGLQVSSGLENFLGNTNIPVATSNESKSLEILDGLLKNTTTDIENNAEVTKESVDNYKEFRDAIEAVGWSTEEAVEHIYNLQLGIESSGKASKKYSSTEMIAAINKLSDGFDELDKIYKSISEKDPFDFTLLANDTKFVEIFGGYKDEYKNFISTIEDSPNDINACQGAFDSLVNTWLNASGILQYVSADTATLTVAMLENRGVANAEAVVLEALYLNKAKESSATQNLIEKTLEETYAHIDVANGISIEEQALAQLALEKIHVNNQQINTSKDIEQVIALAKAAGSSAKVLAALAQAKSVFAQVESGSAAGFRMLEDGTFEEAQALMRNVESGAFDYEFYIDTSKFQYTGGPQSSTSSGGGSSDSKNPKEYDWIERSVKELEDTRQRLKNLIDDEDVSYSDKNNYLNQLLNVDQELLNRYQTSVDEYEESYNRLVSLVPEEYKNLIEHGGSEIEFLEDSTLKNNLDAAIEAYNKLQEARDSIDSHEQEMHEDRKNNHNNILSYYDEEINALDKNNELLESEINYLETTGQIVSSDIYLSLISSLDQKLNFLRKKLESEKARYDDLTNKGDTRTAAESAEWYALGSSIIDTELAIDEVIISQEEYNHTLKMLPVEKLQTVIDMYDDITTTIENFGSELEAAGKSVYENYYQELIDNGLDSIYELKDQYDNIQDIMEDYDPGTEKWTELYERLQSISGEISTMVQNLHKWNEELLKMPINSISETTEQLQILLSGLEGLQSDHDTVISAVVDAIEQQRKSLEEAQKAEEETINKQIEAAQERLDEIQKQNEALDHQREVEQALYDLQRANSQETVQVIRDGQIEYEADAKAIRDAGESYQDALKSLEEYKLQQQIDELNEQLEAVTKKYQDQYDILDKYSEKWSEIAENVERAHNYAIAKEYLGSDWLEKVLSGNDNDIYLNFKSDYENTAEQILQIEKQIATTEKIYELLNQYITLYRGDEDKYNVVMENVQDLLAQLNTDMSEGQNVQNILEYLSKANETEANANSVLQGIQDKLNNSASDLVEGLKTYEENSGMIQKVQSTWEVMIDNISDIRDLMEDVRDIIEDFDIDSFGRRDDDEEDEDDENHISGGVIGAGDTVDYDHSYHGGGGYVASGPGHTSGGAFQAAPTHGGSSSRSSSDEIELINDLDDKEDEYHTGIEKGLIGKGHRSRAEFLKQIATQDLEPNERYIKVLEHEAVFTEDQQKKLMDNFAALSSTRNLVPIITPRLIPIQSVADRMVTINMGNIILPDVTNPDQFAKAMKAQFSSIMRQEILK